MSTKFRQLPTVRPSIKKVVKQEEPTEYTKPIVTTMAKMFPSVDKVCEAKWMNKTFGMTSKKNALLFIADAPSVYGFFNKLELKMAENRDGIRKDIENFVSHVEVQKMISAFKVCLKQKEAEQKVMKKEQERQMIVEQERARIVEEERTNIIIKYHQDEAEAARKKGNQAVVDEHLSKALALIEKQKQAEKLLEQKTTESSDSSGENEEDEDDEESSHSSSKSTKSVASTAAAPVAAAPVAAAAAAVATAAPVATNSKNADEPMDIVKVKQIIEATNAANFLSIRTPDGKEFKILSLIIDRANAKLVINIEQPAQIKVAF
jgi:hypothetical protein